MDASEETLETWQAALQRGVVIPACPLALDANRRLDEERQRHLLRYYTAAGAGGVAIAVHTTQFAIRDPEIGLFEPVLQIAAEELKAADARHGRNHIRIGGICGPTDQAVAEAEKLAALGYHAGLLSLAAMRLDNDDLLILHCKAVAQVIPIIGFYLQPAVGGRVLSHRFWQRFAEIPNVVAIKIAPFNRYQTIDVIRAIAESGREDIALYTGNDDNIVADLITDFAFAPDQPPVRIVGGLLGHWAVWTRKVVEMHAQIKAERRAGALNYQHWLTYGVQVTDANAAFFDPVHAFHGCITGIHEVLRRQGLMRGNWSLNPQESLSPGQVEEIDRVYHAYPQLNDDAFVAENLDRWLR